MSLSDWYKELKEKKASEDTEANKMLYEQVMKHFVEQYPTFYKQSQEEGIEFSVKNAPNGAGNLLMIANKERSVALPLSWELEKYLFSFRKVVTNSDLGYADVGINSEEELVLLIGDRFYG